MNTPPLTRHQRRRLETRRQLLDTTLQLILERGYDAITIQDITDRADLGRGTFYIHFRDKEDAVWAMFADLFAQLEQRAHHDLDRRVDGVAYQGFLNIFTHALENRDLYRVAFGGRGSPQLYTRVNDCLADALRRDILAAPEPEGQVNFHLPVEIEVQILAGAIGRLVGWWLETENGYSPQQMADMLYKAIYRLPPPVKDV